MHLGELQYISGHCAGLVGHLGSLWAKLGPTLTASWRASSDSNVYTQHKFEWHACSLG